MYSSGREFARILHFLRSRLKWPGIHGVNVLPVLSVLTSGGPGEVCPARDDMSFDFLAMAMLVSFRHFDSQLSVIVGRGRIRIDCRAGSWPCHSPQIICNPTSRGGNGYSPRVKSKSLGVQFSSLRFHRRVEFVGCCERRSSDMKSVKFRLLYSQDQHVVRDVCELMVFSYISGGSIMI